VLARDSAVAAAFRESVRRIGVCQPRTDFPLSLPTLHSVPRRGGKQRGISSDSHTQKVAIPVFARGRGGTRTTPAVSTDGPVCALLNCGNRLYMGGDFQNILTTPAAAAGSAGDAGTTVIPAPYLAGGKRSGMLVYHYSPLHGTLTALPDDAS